MHLIGMHRMVCTGSNVTNASMLAAWDIKMPYKRFFEITLRNGSDSDRGNSNQISNYSRATQNLIFVGPRLIKTLFNNK